MEKTAQMQTILALDIGLKRIGVAKAVCNIPLPLPPILRKNRNQAAQEVSTLIAQSKADCLVVGIPIQEPKATRETPKHSNTNADSTDIAKQCVDNLHQSILDSCEDSTLAMQRRIRHFISLLELPPYLQVIFLDESFSSFEALQRLEDKKSRKKAHSKDGSLDSLAALVILERFLERNRLNS